MSVVLGYVGRARAVPAGPVMSRPGGVARAA